MFLLARNIAVILLLGYTIFILFIRVRIFGAISLEKTNRKTKFMKLKEKLNESIKQEERFSNYQGLSVVVDQLNYYSQEYF